MRIRLRSVAVSPHEEYHLRPGEVRPISNDLAAAILSRKGRVEITLKGIVVDRTDMGGRHTFWHEDSILCNDLSAAKGRKIYYRINPLQPDIVHLLDESGSYLESIPVRFRPEVLNSEQQAAEARKQNRQINRVTKHLQNLHGDTTRQIIADMQANSREMKRVVQTLPAPETVRRDEPHPISEAGDRVASGERRITTERAVRQSAIAIGRAITMERISAAIETSEASDLSEDWSNSPRNGNQQPQTTPGESW